jgi:UDP-glucose 4-epimerase
MALGMADKVGIYNLGCGVGTSVNQIFDVLKRSTGYRHEPAHAPAIVGETRHIYLDASKARRELGWEPTLSLESGLAQTVAYYQALQGEGAA